MTLSRRGLLTGLGALIAAPAIVRAGSLMPVRRPALTAPQLVLQWVYPSILDDLAQMDDLQLVYGHTILQTSIGEYGGIIIREISRDQFFREFPNERLPF
jgi:hypothetical protein